jgi:hypothetical protein
VSPESWTRAGHLAAKILRKHARTWGFDLLVFAPRACRSIFHRDEPDSSHYSLLGLGQPVCRLFGLLRLAFFSPHFDYYSLQLATPVRPERIEGLANKRGLFTAKVSNPI